jgi:hypothetical protein
VSPVLEKSEKEINNPENKKEESEIPVKPDQNRMVLPGPPYFTRMIGGKTDTKPDET